MLTLRTIGRGLCALAIPVALIATPAMADSDIVVSYAHDGKAVTQSTPVDISDLQLSSAKGRRYAERRITAAIKTVCSADRTYGSAGKSDYERCFADAHAKAMADAGLIQTASR